MSRNQLKKVSSFNHKKSLKSHNWKWYKIISVADQYWTRPWIASLVTLLSDVCQPTIYGGSGREKLWCALIQDDSWFWSFLIWGHGFYGYIKNQNFMRIKEHILYKRIYIRGITKGGEMIAWLRSKELEWMIESNNSKKRLFAESVTTIVKWKMRVGLI